MRGSLRVEHTTACPAEGTKPQSTRCKCAPRVRARLAGRNYTLGHLDKGWKVEDLGPFEEQLVELRRRLSQGLAPTPKKVLTLAEWALPWFQNLHAAVRAGNVAPTTFNTYEGDWRLHIGPFFKSYPLTAIDTTLINRYVDEKLAVGYSKNKVACSLTVLSGMLTDAVADGKLVANPMRAPRRGRHGTNRTGLQIQVERKAPKHLELEQAIMLLELAPLEIFDMVLCPLVTGFRRMEIAGQEWDSQHFGQQYVDLTHQLRTTRGKYLKVPCKYKSERVVPLASCYAKALGRRREASGWLFTPASTTTPYSETEIKDVLDELYIAAGMKATHEERRRLVDERRAQGLAGVTRATGLGWHALRHTYNSVLAQAGIPKHVREELLGHKKQDVTDRYTHLLAGDFERVREVLDDAFGAVVDRRLGSGTTTSRRPDGPQVGPESTEPMGRHGSSSESQIRGMRL